jgi:hypothetical protein
LIIIKARINAKIIVKIVVDRRIELPRKIPSPIPPKLPCAILPVIEVALFITIKLPTIPIATLKSRLA